MSLSARSRSRSPCHPGSPVSLLVWCSTSIPNPLARRATACPMRPKPTTPSTAPCTSRPRYWSMSQPRHRPPRRSDSASHARRAAASTSRNARSAVVSSRTPGVLQTTTPCSAAASRSMLSWPTATFATTRRRGAPAASTAASMRSVSRETIASASGARATTSSCEKRSPSGSTSSWPASVSGSRPPGGRRRVTRTRANPGSVLAVVDRARALHTDREAEAVDRRVVAHRAQAVHLVGRDVHEVALFDLALLAVDHHDPASRRDVIELVRRVRVRVDETTAGDLELAHQLEEPPVRDLLHLARVHEPPHGHGAVVLDDRRHLFDRPDVHRSLLAYADARVRA